MGNSLLNTCTSITKWCNFVTEWGNHYCRVTQFYVIAKWENFNTECGRYYKMKKIFQSRAVHSLHVTQIRLWEGCDHSNTNSGSQDFSTANCLSHGRVKESGSKIYFPFQLLTFFFMTQTEMEGNVYEQDQLGLRVNLYNVMRQPSEKTNLFRKMNIFVYTLEFVDYGRVFFSQNFLCKIYSQASCNENINNKFDISRLIWLERSFGCFLQSLSSSLIKCLQFQIFLHRF